MGLFGPLFKKDEKGKLGVCIPDASKSKREEAAAKAEANTVELFSSKSFLVTGIFHVQDVLMVQGIAGCKIKKKDKCSFGGTKLVVKDIQTGGASAGSIVEGQKGALFLKAEKGRFPALKQGDELEF